MLLKNKKRIQRCLTPVPEYQPELRHFKPEDRCNTVLNIIRKVKMEEKLKKQIDFIIEIDKIKSIIRKTKLFDGTRYENDAEHSWHICMMAVILQEYSNEKVDLLKVLKMLLIHDLVEIDAGDYLVYTDKNNEKNEKEQKAAERIFSILPDEQKNELFFLWKEFELKETPEAKFAFALDRLEPVMQNYCNNGAAWAEHNIKYEKIVDVNSKIQAGSIELWGYAKSIIEEVKSSGVI